MSDSHLDAHHPMIDELDIEILKHRDVHFGGSFDIMLDYYKNDGVGVMEDFSIGRIEKLKAMGREVDLLLTEEAKNHIDLAKKTYADLRLLYERETDPKMLVVTDLILSEEEVPEKEIAACVTHPESSYPALIHLVDTIEFYDPLFPGYGRAPELAAHCLKRIGNPECIPYLFHALAFDTFFTTEVVLSAIASFGDQAKAFLLPKLGSTPFGRDNELAAIALGALPDDEEIAKAALYRIINPRFKEHPTFLIYLVLLCGALQSTEDREMFKAQLNKDLPKEVCEEIKLIAGTWK